MGFLYDFQSIDQHRIASLTSMKEKKFSLLPFIYQMNSKEPIYIQAQTAQTLHFSLKNTKALLFKTENIQGLFSLKYPKLVCYNWQYVFLMEIISKVYGNFSWVFKKSNTSHMAILQTGLICFIESPITTVKLSRYWSFYLETKIPWTVHTYHRDIKEPNDHI